MPVIYQKMIYRVDLQANPHILYLFGDNMRRFGLGGQAKEMRKEPNAVGVVTKKMPAMSVDSFLTDDEFEANKDMINSDLMRAFRMIRAGGVVVIPLDGLGSGLSELPQRAPKTNAYLLERLKYLAAL